MATLALARRGIDVTLAITHDGRSFSGDVLIGADGQRSLIRAAVAPEHPTQHSPATSPARRRRITGCRSDRRVALLDSIGRRAVIGTPITEYVPRTLARGRISIVGDAAHVPTR